MIKKFKITGLFGFRNVDINFENNVKILIGENGFGKTTVLNSLYYLLNKKYTKLSNIEFETMELNFQNEEKIQFTKFELESYINYIESNNNNRRLVYLSDKIINEIMNNPDKFNARANKESIANRYKDRQDKIKRQNKHFFVENKSQQNMQ